ncbi:hypothetical protein Tco_0932006 [Tanacetum coccineum]
MESRDKMDAGVKNGGKPLKSILKKTRFTPPTSSSKSPVSMPKGVKENAGGGVKRDASRINNASRNMGAHGSPSMGRKQVSIAPDACVHVFSVQNEVSGQNVFNDYTTGMQTSGVKYVAGTCINGAEGVVSSENDHFKGCNELRSGITSVNNGVTYVASAGNRDIRAELGANACIKVADVDSSMGSIGAVIAAKVSQPGARYASVNLNIDNDCSNDAATWDSTPTAIASGLHMDNTCSNEGATTPNDDATCPENIPHLKPVSFASILSSKQVHKKVNFRPFVNEERV